MRMVRTQQRDTVDLLSWRHFGDTSMVEAILDANPGLAAMGIILPHGIEVALPDRVNPVTTGQNLWD